MDRLRHIALASHRHRSGIAHLARHRMFGIVDDDVGECAADEHSDPLHAALLLMVLDCVRIGRCGCRTRTLRHHESHGPVAQSVRAADS